MTKAVDIEAQAALWLVRLEEDDSPATRGEYEAWLAVDPRHRATYLRLEESWRRADRLRSLRPLDGTVNEDLLERRSGQPEDLDSESDLEEPHQTSEPATEAPVSRTPRKRWLALAAAIGCVAVGLATWFGIAQLQWQVYSTERGGLQRIALQDGSTVHLNTGSKLRVRYTPERRELVLTRGEALFQVAHDESRPFDVKAGDTVVRAVGTSFSVRLRDRSRVEVLVTEGRVVIDPPARLMDLKLTEPVRLPTVSMLSAGETVTVEGGNAVKTPKVQKVDSEEITHKLAWVEGRLWFDRVTLAEVVAEFNRYNRRQIVIEDPVIAQLRIGGGFETNDLDSFIAALERSFGVQVEGRDTDVIRLTGGQAPQE